MHRTGRWRSALARAARAEQVDREAKVQSTLKKHVLGSWVPSLAIWRDCERKCQPGRTDSVITK